MSDDVHYVRVPTKLAEPFPVNQISRDGGGVRDGLWVEVHRNLRGGLRFSFWWRRYNFGAMVPFHPGDRGMMEAWEDWYYDSQPYFTP